MALCKIDLDGLTLVVLPWNRVGGDGVPMVAAVVAVRALAAAVAAPPTAWIAYASQSNQSM